MTLYSFLETCKILNISKFKLRYHLDFGNIKTPDKIGPHFRFTENDIKEIAVQLKIPSYQVDFKQVNAAASTH